MKNKIKKEISEFVLINEFWLHCNKNTEIRHLESPILSIKFVQIRCDNAVP